MEMAASLACVPPASTGRTATSLIRNQMIRFATTTTAMKESVFLTIRGIKLSVSVLRERMETTARKARSIRCAQVTHAKTEELVTKTSKAARTARVDPNSMVQHASL